MFSVLKPGDSEEKGKFNTKMNTSSNVDLDNKTIEESLAGKKTEALIKYYKERLYICFIFSFIYTLLSMYLIGGLECKTFIIPGNSSREVQYYARRGIQPSLSDLEKDFPQPIMIILGHMALILLYSFTIAYTMSSWTNRKDIFKDELDYLKDVPENSLFVNRFMIFAIISTFTMLMVSIILSLTIQTGCPDYAIGTYFMIGLFLIMLIVSSLRIFLIFE